VWIGSLTGVTHVILNYGGYRLVHSIYDVWMFGTSSQALWRAEEGERTPPALPAGGVSFYLTGLSARRLSLSHMPATKSRRLGASSFRRRLTTEPRTAR